MRLMRIKAKAFGCLRDWESPLLKPGLILVCGRNESGKSTLFNLVTTLFYGWEPANRFKPLYTMRAWPKLTAR